MLSTQSFFVVDAHTTGTPIRVVTSGIPTLRGNTVSEKMDYMRSNYDWMRKSLMRQPRGFLSLVGAVLTSPCCGEADYGLFYVDALTYQPMCGAGTLSVAQVLVETGMVKAEEPVTTIKLETPSGLVTVFVEIKDDVVRSVSLENVPAFLYERDLEIDVSGVGKLVVDIGFGGNFFTLVDIESIGKKIERKNINELRELSKIILAASNSAIKVEHPLNPAINYMDQLLFCDNTEDKDGTYLCQCIYGDAQADISPCGTGTSTRLAQRFARGLIKIGEPFYQKSIFGGVFEGTPLREVPVADFKGIVPKVSCSDVHITGYNHLIVEAGDKFKDGFVSW